MKPEVMAVLNWFPIVNLIAGLFGLRPEVVMAVIMLESGGSPNAVSSSGAVGLMQVMPREAGDAFKDRPSAEDLRSPAINIAEGCKILRANLDHFDGDLRRALAAYYMGIGGVEKRGLDCADAKTYLTSFEVAWRKLYPDRKLPWED